MEKLSLKGSKKLIPLLAVLALLLGYYFFGMGSSENVTEIVSVDGSSEPLGQDILVIADKLNSLSISTSVFASPLFTTLVDFNIPLQPESQGRPNPFSVVGVDR